MKARRAIRKAIRNQIGKKGFSLVEVLSPCPVQWQLSPVEALHWIREKMIPVFPLAVFRDRSEERLTVPSFSISPSIEEIPQILGLKDEEERDLFPICHPAAERYANPRVIVSGFGGQGALLLGELLAEGAMRHGYQVSWLPSYGPETRGGTAHCHVVISEEAIHSPLVNHPTVLIALNEPSVARFAPSVIPGGLFIYDSSLIASAPSRSDIETIAIPATAIAEKLGNSRAANMVLLGAYLAITNIVNRESIARALSEKISDRVLVELNLRAMDAGQEFAAARHEKEVNHDSANCGLSVL
jgi:2-oxoisovalerate ferredoxin oxidoreductase beta subunit